MNLSHVADPLISPRTSRHPPSASVGNMNLHWSQRDSAPDAGR